MEFKRICPDGPVVIFTLDPRESEPFWLNEYFPDIARRDEEILPPLNDVIGLIKEITGWSAEIKRFSLPCDLKDMNRCSGWNRPEIYLNEEMRNNTSGFALASPDKLKKNLIS